MRRGWLAAAVYGAITVALLFPLLRHFGSAFAHDAGDPVLNAWILWVGSRVPPLGSAWWNAPMFHPMTDAMALSELLLSVLPLTWVVQGLTHNPVAAYNAAFVLSFPLCGLAAFTLARELTGRDDAAVVGGLAFLLAPYRAEQFSHLQVLSYYWTPLALFALHRYLRDSRRRWLVLFGLTWLAQSLVNGYAMFHVSVLVALWIAWFATPIRRAAPIVIAWAIAAVPLLPILLKYQAVHASLHLVRDITEVRRLGVDLGDFLTAAPDLTIWGGRLGLARPETAVFPGLTVILIGLTALVLTRRGSEPDAPSPRWTRAFVYLSAVAGLVAISVFVVGPWAVGPLTVRDFHKPFTIAVYARAIAFLGGGWVRRMWRSRSAAGFYVLAMVAMYVLALGPEPRLLGRPLLYEPPYAWLMRLPGFDVLRVPARFAMLAVLCQSALVAMAIARWGTARWRAPIVAVVTAGVLLDGWVTFPVAATAPPARGPVFEQWKDVAAVIELPLGDTQADFGALFRSMTHQRPIVNGVSGYLPPHYLPLVHAVRDGHYESLFELSASGPLGVVVDRGRTEAPQMSAGLAAAGFTHGASDDRWDSFVVPEHAAITARLGRAVPIASARASMHGEDVGRMLDGELTTAWGTGVNQVGGEDVVLDVGSPQLVGAVVLEMGAFSFGHPRALQVDVSTDGRAWTPAWHGDTSVETVRGAIQQPGRVPIALEFAPASARLIRLTQQGNEPGIPWWIAEVRVYGP